jgi:hypothetical protein
MAKYIPRAWEDDKDDEQDGTTGDRGAKQRRDFYSYSGPELGDNTDATDSDTGALGFTSRRYSSADFRYDDAFDDSSDSWYQRNSFRYTSRADYSPSSLFRSAWSRPLYDTADAQNKAIRALRALTRSANTIVDKSKAGQPPIAVQFSQGADSNGATANITDTKQRIVYVSPDDLMGTTDIAAEDSVVDALTGFVLLRVQMSQDVDAPIIEAINNTGAHLAVVKLAKPFVTNPGKFFSASTEDLHELSAEVVDDCMAGLLAKSVLMRLARRAVVTSWGGFAPYFIRHAKKFEAVRENLEKAPLSLETVVGVLSYNMLADENQLPVAEAVQAAAAKHLGDELAVEDLLPACRALVCDLRKLLAKDETAVPGEMEAALSAMMDAAKTAGGSGPSSEQAAMANFLAQMAEPLLGAQELARSPEAKEMHEKLAADAATADMSAAQSLNALLDRIKQAQNLVKEKLATMTAPEVSEEDKAIAQRQIRAESANVEYNTASRSNLTKLFDSAGMHADATKLKEVIDKTLKAGNAAMPPASNEEDAKKLLAAMEELLATADPILKSAKARFKQAVLNTIAGRKEAVDRLIAAVQAQKERLLAQADELRKQAQKDNIDVVVRESAHGLLANAEAWLNKLLSELAAAAESTQKHEEAAKKARSLSSLAMHEKLPGLDRRLSESALQQLANIGRNIGSLQRDVAIAGAIIQQNSRTPQPATTVQKKIRDDFLARHAVSPEAFLAALAAASGYAFSKSGGDEPLKPKGEQPHPGLSDREFDKFEAALHEIRENGHTPAKAEALGKEIAEKLEKMEKASSPIDKELFGGKIEVKTKALTGESLGHANDEARNDPEEDYVAYIDENSTRPTTVVKKELTSFDGPVRRKQRDAAATIKKVRQQHRGSIERVRNALQFQSGKRTEETYGLRSGELDEGGLHKLGYDCDHIWSQKTISKLPDVAVGILVDQSGSMGGQKIEAARTMCIVLAEALKRVPGVRLYVYGHTANEHYGTAEAVRYGMTIYEHYKPGVTDLTSLGGIEAHCNNYDGYAIKDVAKRLSEDPAKGKHLFVIADGLPAGCGYGGDTAERHVTSVCKFVRERLHVSLNAFAVGIGPPHQSVFKRQYGDNHVVFIDNVMRCLPQIVRFLRNTLQKEKQLVDVEG